MNGEPTKKSESPLPCEDLVRRVFSLGKLGAAVFGPDRRVLWAAGMLPGCDAAAAIGKTCSEVFAGSDHPCEPCLLSIASEEGGVRRLLRAVHRAEGREPRVYEVHVIELDVAADGTRHWLELAREVRGAEGIESFVQSGTMDLVRLIAG